MPSTRQLEDFEALKRELHGAMFNGPTQINAAYSSDGSILETDEIYDFTFWSKIAQSQVSLRGVSTENLFGSQYGNASIRLHHPILNRLGKAFLELPGNPHLSLTEDSIDTVIGFLNSVGRNGNYLPNGTFSDGRSRDFVYQKNLGVYLPLPNQWMVDNEIPEFAMVRFIEKFDSKMKGEFGAYIDEEIIGTMVPAARKAYELL
jgi:hypothetical protein